MAILFSPPECPPPEHEASAARQIATGRASQPAWAALPLGERLRVLRSVRHRLAEGAGRLARTVASGGQRPVGEVLAGEILPLADACRFLERRAPRLLATRRLGFRGRPGWLAGLDAELRREPLGLVLVLAPSNYPLFLPGVQALQALAAGNAVVWKPGRGGFAAAQAFRDLAVLAGLDRRLLAVLPDTPEAGRAALAAAPDRVVLTGSAATGREVLAEAGRRLVPATAELSGCDALFVLPGAGPGHLERAARAVRFGLHWNRGATCLAPRRVFVPRPLAPALEARVAELAAALPAASLDSATAARASALLAEALARGGRLLAGDLHAPPHAFRPAVVGGLPPDADSRLLREDLFAPVVALVSVADLEEALAAARRCPYALGASVFGPEREARALAGRVRAGVVTVNDVIVPTADPRLPFGGRGESGFGVTRGAEGLLEMTAVKAVSARRGHRLPHFEERRPGEEELFQAWLEFAHGDGARARLAGAVRLARAAWSFKEVHG